MSISASFPPELLTCRYRSTVLLWHSHHPGKGLRSVTKLGRARVAFLLLLVVFGIYAGAYIKRTAFVVDGRLHFSLFDDAMVSMRYARNLARGYGLVWNPGGERVEGYTNPLWVLIMALFHLLPLPARLMSLPIQVLGAALLIVNLVLLRRVALLAGAGSQEAALGAVFLTAFYLPLNTWGLQGTEVSLLAVIVTASIGLTLACLREGRFSPWLYLLLGLGTLVRLDMAVPLLAILVYLAGADRANRGRNLAFGLAVLVLFLGAQTVFRLWYYGDLLPNTYYLKLTGYPVWMRIGRGLYAAASFAGPLAWVLAVAGLGALAFRRDGVLPLLVWVFLGQAAYSIYVGGDAWEWWGGANRYLAFAMPALFGAFAGVVARTGRLLAARLGDGRGVRYGQAGLVALALLSAVNFQAQGPQGVAEWLLLVRPLHVEGNEGTARIASLVADITTPQATVAVVWAGAIPYLADREAVDLLGKSDRHIAHLPMRLPTGEDRFLAFYPGHLKWDYAYSIGQLQPDVVSQLWQSPEQAQPYLQRDYVQVRLQGFDLYLRRGSPNILWERVAALQ